MDFFGIGVISAPPDPISIYVSDVKRRVENHWHPKGIEESRPTIFEFKICRSGEITQMRIKQSSQTYSLDEAAHNAIKESNPLPPVPSSLNSPLSVRFVFETQTPITLIPLGPSGIFGTIFVPTITNTRTIANDWNEYVSKLTDKVEHKWHRDDCKLPRRTLIQFRLLRDGSVTEIKSIEAVHSQTTNREALDAIKKAAPFPPLPAGSWESVLVHLAFHEAQATRLPPQDQPTITEQEEVDFGPFMSQLHRKIVSCWHPVHGKQSRRTVISFTVMQDGRLTNLQLERSSHSKAVDKAALNAVDQAAPFGSLPKGSSEEVAIRCTFNEGGKSLNRGISKAFISVPYQQFSNFIQ